MKNKYLEQQLQALNKENYLLRIQIYGNGNTNASTAVNGNGNGNGSAYCTINQPK